MAEVYFYRLTRSPLEVALSRLLARALETGWRVAVRGRDAGRLSWLDGQLWLGAEDGFLPHGLDGGPHDADQPVLLTASPHLPPGVACLMSVDGAAIAAEEAAALQRVCILFDGNDPAALSLARQQWCDVTAAGLGAQYWSEDGGRWEKKLQKAAAPV
ncbi:MAG: DNA polymerase III subunit chi [Rhodobacter sp.]|nr:DNA polymerase III subunit chi [Rhodobacter sp.]MCA3513028.1 DNA polymerase III subunit chi [Rhodobacter sp.]MCA3518736.1 DNA polymerase III subunit chi [Rhodobacter sp.]MCA3522762.1 DNA polymerase III subunit chi [Rhodobacter sp.]MCA3526669.1 DNA polymerase III subunit chi [Rhodobacter sp.]